MTSKLEIKQKQTCIFYLILLGIPSSLTFSVKNKGDGVINGQNLLSVAKVLCWRSLKWLKKMHFLRKKSFCVEHFLIWFKLCLLKCLVKCEGHYILWTIRKMGHPFKANASCIVWTLVKRYIFPKGLEPSEANYII